MNEACREPGCSRTDFYGRGLCGKHYQFYRYHGRLDEVAPRPEDRVCAFCGGPINATLRQWAARFCSSDCSHKAGYETRRPRRQFQRCQFCGTPLTNRPQAKFCSEKCGSAAHNAAMATTLRANRKPCAHCGEPIPLHRHRFCSDKCSLAHRRPEKYGLTPDELVALLAQHSVCAICRTDRWGRKGPQIDHDHATGAIRGVLCSNCNQGLGRFADDAARLETAAGYLRS